MAIKNILKKLLFACLTIFVVLVFNYFLFRILPGDPLAMVARNPKATPEMIEGIRRFYGLDQPWYTQFFLYLRNLFSGDMGNSFTYKAPVTQVIGARILPTVLLLGVSEIFAIILGVLLGIISAFRRGTKTDVATLGFSLFTYAMPTFWFGMIMVTLFCLQLRLFPTSGMVTPGVRFATMGAYIADVARHMVLPVFTMAIVMLGDYALTMRNSMTDVLSEDYIATVRAKGFGSRYMLRRHALPNAMLPMITIIAINLGVVVGGAVQIETIFSWPGLGLLMYQALKARDYPLLQGIFLIITVAVIFANFVADILYTLVDPRVRY